MKICCHCKVEKPLTEFYKNSAGNKDGLSSWCCVCTKQSAARRVASPEGKKYRRRYRKLYPKLVSAAIRKSRLKKVYNLSTVEYEQLLHEQQSCCSICKTPAIKFTKPLCIDHDHQTGKVRGLLCHNCNLLLGNAHDNIDILHESIHYLTKHSPATK